MVLDDRSGGLGAAVSTALAAHLPLEQLALPDGSVAARLPLEALLGDDARVRAALAAWNSPSGWLRAPVARLVLVGGRERDFVEQLALASTAAEAADATRTPWALVHVVQAPDRDGEETLGDALRARFPGKKTARVMLALTGGFASTAALDARLGECLCEALSWRVLAFRDELDRLTRQAVESAAGSVENPRGAEYAAEVADGLAALLEAARWHEPALAACDAFAALLEPHCPLFTRLPLGGSCLDDGTPHLLVDAAPLPPPDASLSRFQLRQRCFSRAARLLQWAGLHEELGARGLVFVRSVAAELAASAQAQAPPAPADMSHPLCVLHLWASGAAVQLAAALRRAAAGLLSNTGAQEQAALAAVRVRQLSRMQGALYTLALTHIRAASKLLALERSAAAPSFEELGELDDVEPLQLLRSSFATEAACEAFCLQLSFAAASAMLAGGQLRAAAKLNLAAGLALLERGAVRRGCSLLVPCCRALIAEGWGSLVAAPLSALVEAAALAGDFRARTEAALMLLSLSEAAVTISARAAALEAIGRIQNTVVDAINCSAFVAVALPRDVQPLQLSCNDEDEITTLVVELHNALPLALELRDLVLRVVDVQQLPVLFVGPAVCVPPSAMQQLTFTLMPRGARAGPGNWYLSRLEARLLNAHVVMQPRRWSPHASCSSVPARWPPIAASSISAGSNALAFVVVEGERKHPFVQLLLPHGSLILGTSAPQLLGLCIASSGDRLLRKASIKISGGPDLEIPEAQTALLQMCVSGSAAAGAGWQRLNMADGKIEIPDMPLAGDIIVWLRVHLRFQTTLRAVDPLDGGAGNESAVFRIEVSLSNGISSSASTLAVRAEAAFDVWSSTKQLPGLDGMAALFARVVSQLKAPTRVRSVALRPHQSGSSATCGRTQCDCKRIHSASSLLEFPLTLQTGGELATLFQLRPCCSVPFAFLDLEFECDASELRSHPEPADWLGVAGTGLMLYSCSVLVRLPDVPPLRVSRFAASLGRVGETIRMRWHVHRLDVGSTGEDACSSTPQHIDTCSVAAELRSTMSAPSSNSAPAYEADDERDDTSHAARGARLSESSQSIWSLRAELQAPASRWLLLGLRDTSLALSSGEKSTIVAECVPVVAGELEAPTLLLRWRGSGAVVRGVWEDPPAAATVQVLPACQ